mmetsp:Transcript_17178/g.33471  ORF Transcript_17178/g.33471 Transcript_17178/m.33471 type:complete len:354 (-) Transcript_17178:310-1371(-)
MPSMETQTHTGPQLPSSSSSSSRGRRGVAANAFQAGPGAGASSGHRFLPVYVFSLLGFPPNLLIHKEHLHFSTRECVVVLQTGERRVPVPYFSNQHTMVVDARDVASSIVAGIAQSIGGLTPPSVRFDWERGRSVVDYLWAHGHHPFGPFSRVPRLGQIQLDTVLRNTILSRIALAIETGRKISKKVSLFTDHFPGATQAQAVAVRLRQDLAELEGRVTTLAEHLHAHQLRQAVTVSEELVLRTSTLAQHAQAELANHEHRLTCCKPVFFFDPAHSSWLLLWRAAEWICVLLVGTMALLFAKGALSRYLVSRDVSTPFRPHFSSTALSATTRRSKITLWSRLFGPRQKQEKRY